MSRIERCLGCEKVRIGDRWYLEGTITAVELTEHIDTYCPSCKEKAARDAAVKGGEDSHGDS